MAVKTENQLSPNARSLWLKALSAFEQRNFGYVVQLARPVLREEPEFFAGRQMLRRAELALSKNGNKGFLKGFSGASLSMMKDRGLVKKDPRAAMEAAEDVLEREPQNPQANMLLRDAALALGLTEIAGFALETLRDANPRDAKVLHELARHYMTTGQPERAIDVYTRITELNPTDMEALKGGKDAAAAASISSGGWEQATAEGGSYRDALKNKEEAVSLERQASMVKSVEAIESQLGELYGRYNGNQQDLNVVRKIAGLHEQKDDYAGALEWYQYAVTLTSSADPGLVRKVSDLSIKNLEFQIRTRENWLEAHDAALAAARVEAGGQEPELDAETAATVETMRGELEEYRRQRAEMQVGEARKRVERNPTDLNFRFELGEQLVRAGQFTEAIPELQKAGQSPSIGVKAKFLLGKCFEHKGIMDLAIKQYEEASAKVPVMDTLKKDLTYALGLAYERRARDGDPQRFLDCMTQIYEVDSGFRDVAARVEGSYNA